MCSNVPWKFGEHRQIKSCCWSKTQSFIVSLGLFNSQSEKNGRKIFFIFLFLFYKEVFQPWPDNRPFTNYKIKLIPITFFFFFLIWDIIWILLLNLMISWNCIHLVQSSHQFRVLQASQGCLWTNQFSKMKWLMGTWLS